ncbi:hypothetical protein SKAU_G00147430 [Synaphobranchus kaupii]|uniref:Uncharacterized protein n=1 Tax=Synaphobranchus kaupii TaxID=118154 RepID=A0A9Q1J2Q0_SYNKA|nr:hypothetical protein SKAU_G00147430 [Synaphobranchus kaupii]
MQVHQRLHQPRRKPRLGFESNPLGGLPRLPCHRLRRSKRDPGGSGGRHVAALIKSARPRCSAAQRCLIKIN